MLSKEVLFVTCIKPNSFLRDPLLSLCRGRGFTDKSFRLGSGVTKHYYPLELQFPLTGFKIKKTKMVKVCFMCKRPFEKASTRSYHLFPNDVSLRHEWFKKLGVEPTGARFLYLCSDHFTSDKFLIRPQGRRVLRKDATPATPVRSPSPATSATTETASEGSPGTTVEDEPTNIETITIESTKIAPTIIESTKIDPNEIEPILKSDSGFILVMTTSLSPAPSPTESAGENCVDFAEEIEITDSPINEVQFPQDPISPSTTIQHQEEIIHVEMQSNNKGRRKFKKERTIDDIENDLAKARQIIITQRRKKLLYDKETLG
ncbi:uncharacterized protein LOC135142625 [Zophobas morio]|uniref:uncharacterized protein LOC135142625 n=1 Tax=Zophobas morio TaxID=2755281 RepID=UPI00308354AE